MTRFHGYQIVSAIHRGPAAELVRVVRLADAAPFILKAMHPEQPSSREVALQRHEFAICQDLLDVGPRMLRALELIEHQNLPAILFEDFDGITLGEHLRQQRPVNLDEFFRIGIQLAEVLGQIHAKNVIHKNIQPASILLHEESGQVRLTDFSLATHLSQETPHLANPGELEGDLAYLSPEQTGRMNRLVDNRSDLYSLGVVLYQLLCHRPPFVAQDPLEMVHSHMARRPTDPTDLVPGLSPVIARIVTRLLAKMAEERYQSAHGLQKDLERCQRELNTYGHISDFTLGEHDRSDRFRLHQQLYGRERQLEVLLKAQEQVLQATRELLLVAGSSGIGKTSLVQELYKPITARRGFFISGKFDQLQARRPYSAVVTAFQELVRQVLTGSEEELDRWRRFLGAALGPNGRVVTEVIPEVELIVGPQPALPTLGPVESQNRFELVFKDFVRVFCRPEHPLTMFLDDLQWADSASLKLVQLMMTDAQIGSLLLIGAYRDNEVDPSSPLMRSVEEMRKAGVHINTISLPPLGLPHVIELLSDSLGSTASRVKPLGELVLAKTAGNPFFVGIFLKSLHDEGLLRFNSEAQEWDWDLPRIQAEGMTDNVGELLAGKVRRYSPETQEVLNLAACMGNQFTLSDLALAAGGDQRQAAALLQQVVADGLLLPLDDSYKLLVLDNEAFRRELKVVYRFAHDRIQRVAYSLVGEEERQAAHARIGRVLLEGTPPRRMEERLFEIVNQQNAGLRLLTSQPERDRLAELNLRAGRRAKAASAFEVSFGYFQTGLELLGPSPWRRRYDLALALFVEGAEAAYHSARLEEMEALSGEVLKEARTLLDKVKAYEVRIHSYKAQHRIQEALDLALQVLRLLGVSLPRRTNALSLVRGLAETMGTLALRNMDMLLHLPPMKDPVKLASMRIITTLCSAAFFVRPDLLPIPVFRAVKTSIRHGNAPESASLFAAYGLVLCVIRQFDSGYRFGQLALKLQERSQAKEHEARTQVLVKAFTAHWKEHLATTIGPLKDAFQTGMQTGDREYAGYAAFFACTHALVCGTELPFVEQEFATYQDAISKLRQATSYHIYRIHQQLVANLQGRVKDPCSLTGEYFDEAKTRPLIEKASDFTTLFVLFTAKLMLCYLMQDVVKALENARKAEHYIEGAGAVVMLPIMRFYACLARLAIYQRVPPDEQKELMARVVHDQRRYLKDYARVSPMNHEHRFHLVEAERLRVLGQPASAERHYEQAIAQCREHQFLHEEAMANELYGRFLLALDRGEAARNRLKRALLGYQRWGSQAKAEQLERRYWTALYPERAREPGQAGEQLDLAAIVQASQAISGEIVLGRLLDRLMTSVLQLAGAQTGCLLMETDGKLYIEAEKAAGDEDVRVLAGTPYESSGKVATSIVNWVVRSGEDLVVHNAVTDHRFASARDPYILSHGLKSVLCLRVVHKNKVPAILYLENNLITGAFSERRLTMLGYLTAQIAISLENARLFANLEKQELRFRELYDNLADSVILVDRNDNILVANPSFYATIEIPRREAGDLTFRRWVHAEDQELLQSRVFVPLTEGGEVRDQPLRLISKRGTVHDMLCTGRAVRREEGRSELLLVLRDVTAAKELEDRLKRSDEAAQHARTGIILGLAKLAEYRDTDTGKHLERIRDFAAVIAEDLAKTSRYRDHITPEFIADLHFSSVLHDIGKVGIPDEILLKPGRLSNPERTRMERHPVFGAQVLEKVEKMVGHQSFLRLGIQIARHHHERWDGKGYPDRLKGEEIPLSARIVALVDVYDALSNKRIYKDAIPHYQTAEQIIADSGTAFDPEVVEAFKRTQEQFDRIRRELTGKEEKPLLEIEREATRELPVVITPSDPNRKSSGGNNGSR